MARQWVSDAIKKPGQLHRDLHVPQGEKIPAAKLAAAADGAYGAKTEQRAHLAQEMRGWSHVGHSSRVNRSATSQTARKYSHMIPSRNES
jgi:hypothetical protein